MNMNVCSNCMRNFAEGRRVVVVGERKTKLSALKSFSLSTEFVRFAETTTRLFSVTFCMLEHILVADVSSGRPRRRKFRLDQRVGSD
jgi:hypothetical protein